MSRRTARDEIALGSDSFLDIVANIVGILIILIVVAGVRVSTAPVPSAEDEDQPPETIAAVEPEPATDFHPLLEEPERGADAAPLAEEDPLVVLPAPEIVPPEPEPPPEPSPELVQRVRDLEAELAALSGETDSRQSDLRRLDGHEQDLSGRLDVASLTFAADVDVLDIKQQQLAELQTALEEARVRRRAVQLRLEAEESERPPAKQIHHKLTPVSRLVQGTEVHFHLSAGRVAYVPVDELTERLKLQVARQKDWLVKFRRHQGSVGPVDGFTMNYVVEREQLSVVDELRQGGGSMRISVSEWQLKPDPDRPGETAAEALRHGSAFFRRLRMTDPDATLTFWVYPDSFALYRELQQFAHAEGFTVAARPLPFGVPIAGSPNGTRSAGQ